MRVLALLAWWHHCPSLCNQKSREMKEVDDCLRLYRKYNAMPTCCVRFQLVQRRWMFDVSKYVRQESTDWHAFQTGIKQVPLRVGRKDTENRSEMSNYSSESPRRPDYHLSRGRASCHKNPTAINCVTPGTARIMLVLTRQTQIRLYPISDRIVQIIQQGNVKARTPGAAWSNGRPSRLHKEHYCVNSSSRSSPK